MKKFLAASAAIALSGATAFAANLPFQTIWDPSNALGGINALVNAINGGVSGVIAVLPAPVTTGGVTIETDFSATLLAGALATGNTVHVKAYGLNDGTADARTVTFGFGASTCAIVVTGTSANWEADLWVTETGSKTQTSMCNGEQGTARLANVQATNWTVDNTAAITVIVRQTAATAGTMTLNEAWVDIMR